MRSETSYSIEEQPQRIHLVPVLARRYRGGLRLIEAGLPVLS